MNVLSLFDGMSCGQIALNRAGIKYDNYFASEIDKYAIKVTQANFPNTIQIGDVRDVLGSKFPKIDLLLGGSPCQGFSFAGKQLAFNDPRSKLFFEFIRIMKECNPTLFLLENVMMSRRHSRVISEYVGYTPLVINSALVSAQNRKRNYWTNINAKPVGLFNVMIPQIPQPKDLRITLEDILDDAVDEKYLLSKKAIEKVIRRNWSSAQVEPLKTGTIGTKNNSGQLSVDKGTTLVRCVSMRGGSVESGGKQPFQQNRVYSIKGVSPALMAQLPSKSHTVEIGDTLRRLTEIECERLQGVPDNYTNHVSSTQRYKMLGNGWQVDTIAHILKHIR